ncbi:unnamed protein product [Hapterophycus canaliculatus]
MTEKDDKDIQRLTDELTAVHQESSRNKLMRGVSLYSKSQHFSNTARAVQTDDGNRRLELEGRRLKSAIAEILKARDSRSSSARTSSAASCVRKRGISLTQKPLGRILVTIDVQEMGGIELEVKYMTRGATWSPSYDIRVDTQTDSVSCTYYGMVSQNTTEDWKGVALRLSTAEPNVHGTPPALGSKIVSLKREGSTDRCLASMPRVQRRKTGSFRARRSSSAVGSDESEESESEEHMPMRGKGSGRGRGGGPGRGESVFVGRAVFSPRAPPPPPQASLPWRRWRAVEEASRLCHSSSRRRATSRATGRRRR